MPPSAVGSYRAKLREPRGFERNDLFLLSFRASPIPSRDAPASVRRVGLVDLHASAAIFVVLRDGGLVPLNATLALGLLFWGGVGGVRVKGEDRSGLSALASETSEGSVANKDTDMHSAEYSRGVVGRSLSLSLSLSLRWRELKQCEKISQLERAETV